jgi:protein O-GlcNAc transferase
MAKPHKTKAKPASATSTAERDQASRLFNSGRFDEADAAFRRMLARNPADVFAIYHVVLGLYVRKRFDEALKMLQRSLSLAPHFPPNWYAQAMLLQALGRQEEALRSYDEALRLQHNYPEALLNSGVLLREMWQHGKALERFQRLLAFDPVHQPALANAATLLEQMGQPGLSIPMFARLLQINPAYPYGLGMLCYDRLKACDWTDIEPLTQGIVQGLGAGQMSCRPFALMAVPSSASDQYLAARIFAADRYPRASVTLWQGEPYRHERLRIGYVSPDFREHPVSHLMSGIFERHDRSRFETIAISIGMNDKSHFRARLEKSFDRFVDVAGSSSLQIAQRIREMEVDILIDLAGYTADGRPDIFAFRPAPVQATYLGYPGTLGSDYYDYIIADRHVIPPEHQAFYAEKVAYLPDTYLPTDCDVRASDRTPTRAECGLPETGPVLCAFSHNFKIHPLMFDCWMRLLQRLPGSVLWLAGREGPMQGHLRAAAQARGVDPDRLVFSHRVPRVEDHLARYRLADVFLDTAPYNAHTTTADALMAGLPVVTVLGPSFPSRVAASVLHAIGLPELVTPSMEAYESLVVELISHPPRLQDLKARLAENRRTHPLFDTERFCRNLEIVFATMAREHQARPAAAEVA